MKFITLEYIRDVRRACYSADRLAALYDRPHTPLEVLTRNDGPWADVPPQDRLWTVLHDGVLPDKMLRLFACDCAERALTREREAGREPDVRSWEAVQVSRRFANGQATHEELSAARAAAASAAAYADDAATSAAYAAAYAADAATSAAYVARAATDTARAATYAAAYADDAATRAAYAAAYAAERRWQVEHLVNMIQEESA